MESQLCVTVELFCWTVRNIFPRTSLHDLPCHKTRTMKNFLHPISWELVVFLGISRNLGFEHISVIVHNILVFFDIFVEYNPNKHRQGMMFVGPNRFVSSILSTLEQCFVSFQPVFISSTYTDMNNE